MICNIVTWNNIYLYNYSNSNTTYIIYHLYYKYISMVLYIQLSDYWGLNSLVLSVLHTSEHCLFNLHSSKPIWCTISPLSRPANGCTPPFISLCSPAVLPCRSAACLLLCCCSAFLQYCPTNDISFPPMAKKSPQTIKATLSTSVVTML